MPTGYTADVISGKTTTFKEFAIKCMRAFGATIHMRDDNMETEYYPREVSPYHKDALDKALKQLGELESSKDKFMKEYIDKRKEDLKYAQSKLVETLKNKEGLEKMLEQVKAYEPPTLEHIEYKKFMIQQLEDTIKWDGNPSYDQKQIEEIEADISSPDEERVLMDIEKSLRWDIEYHTNNLNDEIKRVEGSNKWVEDILNSLK